MPTYTSRRSLSREELLYEATIPHHLIYRRSGRSLPSDRDGPVGAAIIPDRTGERGTARLRARNGQVPLRLPPGDGCQIRSARGAASRIRSGSKPPDYRVSHRGGAVG
ncbi:hypothetical protein D3C76_1405350 [compost metagenome]